MNWRPMFEDPERPLSCLIASRDQDDGERHLLGIWEWDGRCWRDEEGVRRPPRCGPIWRWWCPESEVLESMDRQQVAT